MTDRNDNLRRRQPAQHSRGNAAARPAANRRRTAPEPEREQRPQAAEQPQAGALQQAQTQQAQAQRRPKTGVRPSAERVRANARRKKTPSNVPPEIAELRYADRLPKRCYNLVTIVFLVVIALIALTAVIMPDREFSDEENRVLASFPTISVAGVQSANYMSDLESYIADQFPLRDAWMRLKMRIALVSGEREFNGVFLGRDHYLIQAPAEPDYDRVAENLNAMNSFQERHSNLGFNMLVAPNAATVMADWLPTGAVAHDQQQDVEFIQTNSTINYIDVAEALSSHVDEGLYYHTDHHWTSTGARYAFEAAAPTLGVEPVSEYNVYAVTTDFQGTLASSSGYHGTSDVIEVYEPLGTDVQYLVTDSDDSSKRASVYSSAMLEQKDKYQAFFGGNHAVVNITTDVITSRRLLVIKDSYANSFVPFLIPYYNRIVMVDPRYCSENVDDIITSEGITDVLFLYNLDTFMQDTSISTLLSPASE